MSAFVRAPRCREARVELIHVYSRSPEPGERRAFFVDFAARTFCDIESLRLCVITRCGYWLAPVVFTSWLGSLGTAFAGRRADRRRARDVPAVRRRGVRAPNIGENRAAYASLTSVAAIYGVPGYERPGCLWCARHTHTHTDTPGPTAHGAAAARREWRRNPLRRTPHSYVYGACTSLFYPRRRQCLGRSRLRATVRTSIRCT